MNKKEQTVIVPEITTKTATIRIIGDTDLVLNKMNDRMAWELGEGRDQPKGTRRANEWEDIITSMHWYDGKPTDFSEEGLNEALKTNRPCITAFGLKKSFCNAVVRNEIDKYSTKFDAAVNILGKGGLIPISFTEHVVDSKLMSPQKGRPVLCRLNRFIGWSAEITFQYVDKAFTLEQILNIINLAGFGIGIGSGRTSGFGRYHIESN